jgi:hypothetical protein
VFLLCDLSNSGTGGGTIRSAAKYDLVDIVVFHAKTFS